MTALHWQQNQKTQPNRYELFPQACSDKRQSHEQTLVRRQDASSQRHQHYSYSHLSVEQKKLHRQGYSLSSQMLLMIDSHPPLTYHNLLTLLIQFHADAQNQSA